MKRKPTPFAVRFMFNTAFRAIHKMDGKYKEVTWPGMSRIKHRQDFITGIRICGDGSWPYKKYWQVKRRMRKNHRYQDDLANLAMPAIHREGF